MPTALVAVYFIPAPRRADQEVADYGSMLLALLRLLPVKLVRALSITVRGQVRQPLFQCGALFQGSQCDPKGTFHVLLVGVSHAFGRVGVAHPALETKFAVLLHFPNGAVAVRTSEGGLIPLLL